MLKNNEGLKSILENAYTEIKRLKQELQSARQASTDVAIVGMACRFPKDVRSPDEFWQNLLQGSCAIQYPEADRFSVGEKTYKAGYVDRMFDFDPGYFGINSREAEKMDPQQRLFLQVTWEALESAGIRPKSLKGSRTGVFSGVSTQDYLGYLFEGLDADKLDLYCLTGNVSSFVAGRTSYLLGAHGPSLAVDTACSSSLVAVHLACQSLLSGESELAIAGGVNLIMENRWNHVLQKAQMLAPDGLCKTFDAKANGYVRGEGCGVVILKRYDHALRDQDSILAVIKASAVNHNGQSSGITVPSEDAEAALLRQTLDKAGIRPDEVAYLETHGTGTPLGDPIEVNAIRTVYDGPRSIPLILGSVKTNIGHLEAAAGIAGLIKSILILRHGRIPPSLHFNELNTAIELGDFRIATDTVPLETGSRPILGVSSFGASGTNSHLLLAAAPAALHSAAASGPEIFTLSALSEKRLQAQWIQLDKKLPQLTEDEVGHFAAHLRRLRSQDRVRVSVVAANAAEAQLKLGEKLRAENREPVPKPGNLAFVFSGQGSQYRGMAQELYRTEPQFRKNLDQCASILQERYELDLLGILNSDDLQNDAVAIQCGLFCLGYSLAKLWEHWGAKPSHLFGYSFGEYIAAAFAGIWNLSDALTIVHRRAELLSTLSRGRMIYLSRISEQGWSALQPKLEMHRLSIASTLGQDAVISGAAADIESFQTYANEQGMSWREIAVSHGFHSAHMDPIVDALADIFQGIPFHKPRYALASNVTGQLATGTDFVSVEYWQKQLRSSIAFEAGIQTLAEARVEHTIEIGPKPALSSMIQRLASKRFKRTWPSLTDKKTDRISLYQTLSEYYEAGYAVDWERFHDGKGYRKCYFGLNLDFDNSLYKPEVKAKMLSTQKIRKINHPLVKREVLDAASKPYYEAILNLDHLPSLEDFVIDGVAVVNIGVFTEIIFGAFQAAQGQALGMKIAGFKIHRSISIKDTADILIQVRFHAQDAATFVFELSSNVSGDWQLHVSGQIQYLAESTPADSVLATFPSTLANRMAHREFYRSMFRRGIHLGPGGTWLKEVQFQDDLAFGLVRSQDEEEAGEGFHLHPGLTDSCFQLLYAFLKEQSENNLFMLHSIQSLTLTGYVGRAHRVIARKLPSRVKHELLAELWLLAEDGGILAIIQECCLRRASKVVLEALDAAANPEVTTSQATKIPERSDLARVLQDVLGCREEDLDWSQSLHQLGMDSLLAVELKEKMVKDLSVSIPLSLLFDGISIEALYAEICQMIPPSCRQPGSAAAEPGVINRTDGFGLTDLQQAYYLGRSADFDLGNTATYFYQEVELENLDPTKLERVFNLLIQRHDMLRAVFSPDGTQSILPEVPAYSLPIHDFSELSQETLETRLTDLRESLKSRNPDCHTWPLFDFSITLLPAQKYRLHIGLDALIIDAWSTSALFKELAALYQGQALPAVSGQFRDYIEQLALQKNSEQYKADLEFWRQKVQTLPMAPALPVLEVSGLKAQGFTHRSFLLPKGLWQKLKDDCKKLQITPTLAIMTMYAEILACYSKSRHFTLNMLRFNRNVNQRTFNGIIGNFSSTFLMEVDLRSQQSFLAQVRNLQREMATAFDHGSVSGIEVLRELNRHHGNRQQASMPVVFASTINFNQAPGSEHRTIAEHLNSLGENGRDLYSGIRTPQVWLDHQIVEDYDGLRLNWDTIDSLFPSGMLDEMFGLYELMIHELAKGSDVWQRTMRLELAGKQDLSLREAFNSDRQDFGRSILHADALVSMQKYPDKLAVICGEKRLTYAEMDGLSQNVCLWLRGTLLQRGQHVAIIMEKSWEQALAALSIVRNGDVYVPMDASLPAERLKYLLDAAQIGAIVTQPNILPLVQSISTLPVHVIVDDAKAAPADFTEVDVDGRDLAYIIYTSGSTGLPKGVAIEHASAMNTIADINHKFQVGLQDVVFGISSLSFDLSVYDIFGCLAVGGTLVLPKADQLKDPACWYQLMEEHQVSCWNSVPSLVDMLVTHVEGQNLCLSDSLRLIMMSGDWIPVTLPRMLWPRSRRGQNLEIISLGGATEASIWSNYHRIDESSTQLKSIPYGVPLANQTFQVYDEFLAPCPAHVPGELYIGGIGLAQGYWNDAERTNRSFIIHPRTQQRLYRTGDLGRYYPDGQIEFLGREDSQVKINGYRIELGEVEAALNACPGVGRVIVLAHGDIKQGRSLVAYYVAESGAELTTEALLAFAGARLPSYMLPKVLVPMDALPLTANGKIDRKALPDPLAGSVSLQRKMVEPVSDLEKKIHAIWQDILGQQELSVLDNFFDRGGQSFLAVKLMAEISKQLQRRYDLSALLQNPNIAALAAYIEAAETPRLVVPLFPSADKPLLFLVHPVGGNVFCYREIAEGLADRYSVHGIHARGLNGDEPHSCIKQMAAAYIEEIRKLQIAGPFHLGGWSLGGVIAFEMTRQLEREGEAVQLLFTIDSIIKEQATDLKPVQLLENFVNDIMAAEKEPISLTEEEHGHPDHLVQDAYRRLKEKEHIMDIPYTDFNNLFRVYAGGIKALDHYRPEGKIRSTLLSIEATQGFAKKYPTRPWSGFADRLRVQQIQGDHYSIVTRSGRKVLDALQNLVH